MRAFVVYKSPMRLRGLTLLPVVLTAVLVLATGCGGDDAKPTSSPSSSPSLTGPGTDPSANFTTADEFMQALAANTKADLAGAEALVAPKSAAARYLVKAQDGVSAGPLTLTAVSKGTYRLCAGTDCTVISDIVLADGKISSFKVDGKQAR